MPRHRLRDARPPRRALLLARRHLLHEFQIAARVGGILVRGEVGGAKLDESRAEEQAEAPAAEPTVEDRRADVHAKAREAIDELKD